MERTHVHFSRLNPVEPRLHRPGMDLPGVIACLVITPTVLFWLAWIPYGVFGMPGLFRAIFSISLLGSPFLYLFIFGFPLVSLVLGTVSFVRRRRRYDLATVILPLSLLLLAAGILYGLVRLSVP